MADELRSIDSIVQIDGIDYSLNAVTAKTAATAEKVTNSLTIKGNNTKAIEFDGSAAGTLNIVGTGGASVTASGNTITINTSVSEEAKSELVEGTKVSTGFKVDNTTITTGESGKLYVDTSTNKIYRWTGSAFTEMSPATQNQNVFSKVKVDKTTIEADNTTDTLTLIAGDNIIITPNATNDSITIAASGVSVSVIDDLTSESATDALSANQGRALNEKIAAINTNLGNLGGGDMLKSEYASQAESQKKHGWVDNAINAEKLGNISADDIQTKLVSGTTIKTINEQSILGNGNITIDDVSKLGGIAASEYIKKNDNAIPAVINNLTSDSITDALSAAQGKALKTAINSITVDIENLGGGDMLKATYDTNQDGKVDIAENADKLGGVAASAYAKKSDIPSITISQNEPTDGAIGDIWFKIN